MSTYLDKLIDSVKRELGQEEDRLKQTNFSRKGEEAREIGMVRRLQQRLNVLESLARR